MLNPKSEILPEFVEVALPLPLKQTFTYRLPVGLQENIKTGARLLVPFGKRQLTGYAVALHVNLTNPSARATYEHYGFVATGELEELRPGSDQQIELMRLADASSRSAPMASETDEAPSPRLR